MARHGRDGAVLMQTRAMLHRSACQTAGIGQRLDRARARIMQRTMDPFSPGACARRRRIQQRDRRPQCLLLFESGL